MVVPLCLSVLFRFLPIHLAPFFVRNDLSQGVAAESSWVPLWDAGNPAQREQHLSMLLGYVLEEEARGGLRYTGHPRWFTSADARAGADPTTHPNRTDRIDSCTTMSARETLAYAEETEMPPLCKWTGNWFQRRHVN